LFSFVPLNSTNDLLPRQLAIVESVARDGPQGIDALAERFGVTLQTVRRDVQRLAEAGLLTRFHGGVRQPGSTTENMAYRQRQGMHAQAKSHIAQAVAQRVPDGSSLILNIGTTVEAVAQALRTRKALRVITNNLHVAAAMSTHPDCEVIVAGGLVRGADQGIVGEAAIGFFRQFRVDIGIIGISGIESDGSLRDFDFREVQVARTIVGQSREVWLVADHSKFNRPAMVELASLEDVDVLFTDRPPGAPFDQLLAQADVECVVCTPHSSGHRPPTANALTASS
jgi:DeoR family transcriptional regulator, glycerol-3-phosphate regulon repressor